MNRLLSMLFAAAISATAPTTFASVEANDNMTIEGDRSEVNQEGARLKTKLVNRASGREFSLESGSVSLNRGPEGPNSGQRNRLFKLNVAARFVSIFRAAL